MFNTYRLGYHIPFLKNAFLLNPLSQLPIDLYNLKYLRPLQYSMINGRNIFGLNQDFTWDINFDILL